LCKRIIINISIHFAALAYFIYGLSNETIRSEKAKLPEIPPLIMKISEGDEPVDTLNSYD
jgi:hypothetical protein